MKKTYAILAVIAALVLTVYALLPDSYFEETVFPLKEGVSVFVLGSAVAANVVVVKADYLGLVADGLQFHRKFFGACCLSRA